MVYEVVHCAECGKPIKSVPSWLAGVDVKFSCEACRQKHPRPFLGPDSAAPVRGGRRDEGEEEGAITAVASADGDEDAPIEDLPEDFTEDEPVAEESLAE